MFQGSPIFQALHLPLTSITTQLEIEQHLGSSLAHILYDYNPSEANKILDSLPLKKLPEHVRVKSNFQSKRNKFFDSFEKNELSKICIHQKILDLGEEMFKKYHIQTEAKVMRTLQSQFVDKYNLFEAKKRRTIQLLTEQINTEWTNYIKTLKDSFEIKLESELMKHTNKCKKKIQQTVRKERVDLIKHVLKKVRYEICNIITNVYDELGESYLCRVQNIIADFNAITREKQKEVNKRLQELKEQNKEALDIQQRNLQAQNITDITYILYKERLQATAEKYTIYTYFENQIQILKNLILYLNNIIINMTKIIIRSHYNNELLKEKLRNITKEFQKFISCAFNNIPEQDTFLLSSDIIGFT